MDGHFPSFYGEIRVVRVIRIEKEGFVKRLREKHTGITTDTNEESGYQRFTR